MTGHIPLLSRDAMNIGFTSVTSPKKPKSLRSSIMVEFVESKRFATPHVRMYHGTTKLGPNTLPLDD